MNISQRPQLFTLASVVLLGFFVLQMSTVHIAHAADPELIPRLSGRIMLQVEDHGEAWYVYPRDKRRYSLGNGDDANALIRSLGIGISNAKLARIPKAGDKWNGDPALMKQVQGMILLQVESRGEAWYVNPANGRRQYLKTGAEAYRILREQGLGVKTSQILRINPSVEISFVHTQGSGSAQADEYVELQNAGSAPVNFNEWSLTNIAGKRVKFPKGITLVKNSTVRVYTNSGKFKFSQSKELWNNTKDRVTLKSPAGTEIDVFAYDANRNPSLRQMTFSVQAPTGNWSLPYKEACEETILVMLDHFYRRARLGSSEANAGILRLVAWENAHIGKNDDTGVKDTSRMAQEVYAYRSRIIWNDITVGRIRELLQLGKPVIIPASLRDMGNIHFTNQVTIYHMTLLIGYENGQFISHDPGTRHGGLYRYNAARLVGAIHDLTTPEWLIRSGKPAILVVEN